MYPSVYFQLRLQQSLVPVTSLLHPRQPGLFAPGSWAQGRSPPNSPAALCQPHHCTEPRILHAPPSQRPDSLVWCPQPQPLWRQPLPCHPRSSIPRRPVSARSPAALITTVATSATRTAPPTRWQQQQYPSLLPTALISPARDLAAHAISTAVESSWWNSGTAITSTTPTPRPTSSSTLPRKAASPRHRSRSGWPTREFDPSTPCHSTDLSTLNVSSDFSGKACTHTVAPWLSSPPIQQQEERPPACPRRLSPWCTVSPRSGCQRARPWPYQPVQ